MDEKENVFTKHARVQNFLLRMYAEVSLCVNPQKTVIMETSRRALPTPLSIELAQDALTKVQSHRHLGVIFSHDLRWNNHVDFILSKATRLLSVLRRLRSSLDQESLSHMYLRHHYRARIWTFDENHFLVSS